MNDVTGPTIVVGRTKTSVQFKESVSGKIDTFYPDASSNFRAIVPEGKYVVSADGFEQSMTLLPGASYKFDPTLDFFLESATSDDGQVMIKLIVGGKGKHNFSVRTENLSINDGAKDITLKANRKQKTVWTGKIENINSPWFAVVIPDNDLTRRKEINGVIVSK
jgi:hypothetical protein